MSERHHGNGLRAHNARYNIDSEGRRRLRAAFATLVDLGPSIDKALADSTLVGGELRRVQHALRLLVDGPNGEFFS
jgi:hypothetical protein